MTPIVLVVCAPTKEPNAIPMLKAEILNAEASVISFGVYVSANCTTYNCRPGTFIKENSPRTKVAAVAKNKFPLRIVPNKNTKDKDNKINMIPKAFNGRRFEK